MADEAEGDYEVEEIPVEEKLEIARKLLMQSPPGELLQVANDVRALLGDDSLLNSIALDVFREYNTEQMIAVQVPNSEHQALITKVGEVDASTYIDPRNGQLLTVDHIKQVCIGAEPIPEEYNTPAEAQAARKDLEQALQSYVESGFPSAGYAVYGAASGGQITLTVCISSAKFSPKNFWNGRWRSTWTATLEPGSSTWQLAGKVKVLVHYFEEGNVQLDTDYDIAAAVPAKDGGPAITAAIEKAEQAYLATLEETYSNLSDTVFKELRRTLPVTRTKFPWAQQQHSLATELKRNS